MASTDMRRPWARGGTMFGATMMLIIGMFQLFEGIAAIINRAFFVIQPNYAYQINTHTWGWIHLGVGIVCILTGLYLFTGSTWARIAGIALASISAIGNFFFLPYFPFWSLLLIALDIFVIWSLASVSLRPGDSRADYQYRDQTADASVGAHASGVPAEGQRWASTNQPSGRNYADQRVPDNPGRAMPSSGQSSPQVSTQPPNAQMPNNPQSGGSSSSGNAQPGNR